MGNSVCCTQPGYESQGEQSPHSRKKGKALTPRSGITFPFQEELEVLEEGYQSGDDYTSTLGSELMMTGGGANSDQVSVDTKNLNILQSQNLKNSISQSQKQNPSANKVVVIKSNQSAELEDGRGPVSVCFQLRSTVQISNMAFSQRRRKGFRNFFELDHRRVLVADSQRIQVFGYNRQSQLKTQNGNMSGDSQNPNIGNMKPFLLTTYDIGETVFDNAGVPKEFGKGPNEKKQTEDLPACEEEIVFASFMSDYEPSLILLLTYNGTRFCSYLRVLKIYNQQEYQEDLASQMDEQNNAQEDLRTYSEIEDAEKSALIQNLRQNLQNDPNVHAQTIQAFLQDNVQVQIDKSQSKAKIINRGLMTAEVQLQGQSNVSVSKRRNSQNNGNGNDLKARTYHVRAAKLIKFRDSKLQAIKYSQSGSNGKLLITFDQSQGPIIRFHKLRGLRPLLTFDFNTEDPLDYKWSDLIETSRIELNENPKKNPQPKNPRPVPQKIEVVQQDDNLDEVDNENVMEDMMATLKNDTKPQKCVRTVLYYAGHIMASYNNMSIIDVFKVNGPLMQTINLQPFMKPQISQIDNLLIPRLDWQDREFDTIQRSQKRLPRKLICAGEYKSPKRDQPFLIMHDKQDNSKTITRLYKSKGHITCIHYGPYDNGHILVGLSTGDFFAFDAMTLKKLCNLKVSESPITNITMEPTQMLFIGVRNTQELIALTFIQTKQQYLYMEIAARKYATVVIDNEDSHTPTTNTNSSIEENGANNTALAENQ